MVDRPARYRPRRPRAARRGDQDGHCPDLGVQRSLSFYEREAWMAARRLGWHHAGRRLVVRSWIWSPWAPALISGRGVVGGAFPANVKDHRELAGRARSAGRRWAGRGEAWIAWLRPRSCVAACCPTRAPLHSGRGVSCFAADHPTADSPMCHPPHDAYEAGARRKVPSHLSAPVCRDDISRITDGMAGACALHRCPVGWHTRSAQSQPKGRRAPLPATPPGQGHSILRRLVGSRRSRAGQSRTCRDSWLGS